MHFKKIDKRGMTEKREEYQNKIKMIRKLRGKKGISHVEMILSFVIFIGFLIFLFAIFKPLRVVSGGEVYLDILERGINDNVSIDVNFQTLKINDSVDVNCFCIEYSLKNIIVKNENEIIINSETGDNLCMESLDKFFYIYSSEEFESSEGISLSSCSFLEKDKNYTLGLFRSYSFYSNRSLKKLHYETANNYDDVKDKLELRASKDFSFSLRMKESNEIILENTKKPGKGVRVLARDVPVQIVYNNGKFEYALLNIQVW